MVWLEMLKVWQHLGRGGREGKEEEEKEEAAEQRERMIHAVSAELRGPW